MTTTTTFSTITPLASGVTRSAALSFLQNHIQMIRLNPLVLRLQPTTPPPSASADEYNCDWYAITDEIAYLPGNLFKSEVTYKACFNDLPDGIQTHTFAPAGLDLRGKWTVHGNEPGEPRERLELGNEDAPREGLYVREDVEMRCNFLLTGFVRRNLTKSHKVVVERLAELGSGQPSEHQQDGRQQDGEQYQTGGSTAAAAAGGAGSVPTPWNSHAPDRNFTPVDSNTIFGPDSYLHGQPARPDPSIPVPPHNQDSELADPQNTNVGQPHHRPSPRRLKKKDHRSHLNHSLIPGDRTTMTGTTGVSSRGRLSCLEHERRREERGDGNGPPRLPPLSFLAEGGRGQDREQEEEQDLGLLYQRLLPQQEQRAEEEEGDKQHHPPKREPRIDYETAPSFPTTYNDGDGHGYGYGYGHHTGILHDPSVRAELPAEKSPVDERSGAEEGEVLRPGHVKQDQRMSTDHTWRPGEGGGGFI